MVLLIKIFFSCTKVSHRRLKKTLQFNTTSKTGDYKQGYDTGYESFELCVKRYCIRRKITLLLLTEELATMDNFSISRFFKPQTFLQRSSNYNH